MSLINYQDLKNKNKNKEENTLWINLPELTLEYINISHNEVQIKELIKIINQLAITSGWAMYRDELIFTTKIDQNRYDLIEAEFTDGNKSLTIKLVGTNKYSVRSITTNKVETEIYKPMVYKKQPMRTRQLSSNKENIIEYRIWYKEEEGRWDAVVQQFIGIKLGMGEQ